MHSLDLQSESFKNLGVKEKYDVLIELKETRKQSSWGRLKELPKNSDTFADFQVILCSNVVALLSLISTQSLLEILCIAEIIHYKLRKYFLLKINIIYF